MTRVQRLRTWLDKKAGRSPDKFDVKSEEILRSPTASEADKKNVQRLVRSYDRRWVLGAAALAAAPRTAMGCVIADLPIGLVLLIVGCQVTGSLLFWLETQVPKNMRRRVTQTAWAVYGGGTTAGLYQLLTM